MITFVDLPRFKRFSSMDEVMEIEPYAFEFFSKWLLEVLGYKNVAVTRKRGKYHSDDGVDILARHNGSTIVGQCKRWLKGRMGYMPIEQVRALRGSMTDNGVNEGVFISTLPFGQTSKRYAEKVNIKLIGPHEIKNVLNQVNPAFGKSNSLNCVLR